MSTDIRIAEFQDLPDGKLSADYIVRNKPIKITDYLSKFITPKSWVPLSTYEIFNDGDEELLEEVLCNQIPSRASTQIKNEIKNHLDQAIKQASEVKGLNRKEELYETIHDLISVYLLIKEFEKLNPSKFKLLVG